MAASVIRSVFHIGRTRGVSARPSLYERPGPVGKAATLPEALICSLRIRRNRQSCCPSVNARPWETDAPAPCGKTGYLF